jgi:hypothetical protein
MSSLSASKDLTLAPSAFCAAIMLTSMSRNAQCQVLRYGQG